MLFLLVVSIVVVCLCVSGNQIKYRYTHRNEVSITIDILDFQNVFFSTFS